MNEITYEGISDELLEPLKRALENLAADLRYQASVVPKASAAVISYAEAFDELPYWLAVFPDGVCEGHENPWDVNDSSAGEGVPLCVEIRHG